MKLWLFGSYSWQGNPKALLMYMQKHNAQTHDVWWVADTRDEMRLVKRLGYKAILASSSKAAKLFAEADVYVTENFRETYPASLNPNAIILNLWHGVGLKHIELGLGAESALADGIVKKYVRNYPLYKNNLKFLATSEVMEEHFIEDMPLDGAQIIKGGYPRNQVYRDPEMRTDHGALDFIDNFDKVYLYAPTYRYKDVNGAFKQLLPDLKAVADKMAAQNGLLILKLHPFMLKDPEYQQAMTEFSNHPNLLFWDDKYDVYEIFNKITVGIIDYSSIFYDLLESGVDQFIRYIPDFEEYTNDSELIGDYFELTGGTIVTSFSDLLTSFNQPQSPIENKAFLMTYFFGYEKTTTIDYLIEDADAAQPRHRQYPELHTFDIFDTLIKRDTLEPISIFAEVQEQLVDFEEPFERYLIDNYQTIRQEVEADLRDVFKKTTYERQSNTFEVTLQEILSRLQQNYHLSDAQTAFLYEQEVSAEISAVQPIQKRINMLFELIAAGNDVKLVSDMYLPKAVIQQMLEAADPRLVELPLYVSSEVGYQKSTGKLFDYVFFDSDYHYAKWVHYGDNKHADGKAPRKLGIQTYNHDMDTFVPNEQWYVEQAQAPYRYDAYKLATAFQRRRQALVNQANMTFDMSAYYAYAYIGPTFVPYVHWALADAIERGYETLYFISRDGYYLKQIADVIIAEEHLSVKAKFIYGSRKAWRVPSFINEVDPASFTPFGMFTLMDSFDDLVKSSQLPEAELLELLPELETYRHAPTLKGAVANTIREIFSQSEAYQNRLLEIAAERRPIVTDYLKQEIDFDEKFAFVEFWGRGYTQDTLTRLLEDAAGHPVDNPFYYVRNFTDNDGHSIRHRFTQMPVNFSPFESIFATTPYKSIPGYERDVDGTVKPIITRQENEYHAAITENIQLFARDFVNLHVADGREFDRFTGESAYKYFFKHPYDGYITSVFARYKDNVAMYGEPQEYAPILSAKQVQFTTPRRLRQQTRNLEMSLSRSSDSARAAYRRIQKLKRGKVTDIPQTKVPFPVNDLGRYVHIETFPCRVVLQEKQFVYASVHWTKVAKSKYVLQKGTVITVLGIDWTNQGVPRLRTELGYISANKQRTAVTLSADADNIIKKPLRLRPYVRKQAKKGKKLLKAILKRTPGFDI